MKLLVTGGAGFIGSNFVRWWARRAPGRHGRRVRRAHLRRQPRQPGRRAARVRARRHRRPRLRGEDAARLRDRHDRQLRGRVAQLVRDHESRASSSAPTSSARRRCAKRCAASASIASTASITSPRARSTATSPSTRRNRSTSRRRTRPARRTTRRRPAAITRCARTTRRSTCRSRSRTAPTTTGRTSSRRRSSRCSRRVRSNDQEIPLYQSTQNRREWIHADDHCRAIARILDDGRVGETYHVGTGEERSIEEIADGVLAALGQARVAEDDRARPARSRSALPARRVEDPGRARLGAAGRVRGRTAGDVSSGTRRIAPGGSRCWSGHRSTRPPRGSDLSVARPGHRRRRHGRTRGRRGASSSATRTKSSASITPRSTSAIATPCSARSVRSHPDAIVHCAAMTAVDACETEQDRAFLVNALGVRFVMEGARRAGAYVVALSTDYVFDGTQPEPYHEWDTPNPASVYGQSKLAGEFELDLDCAVVRTSWVIGRYGANMAKTILRLAGGDAPLRFVDDQRGCPTVAADLATMLRTFVVERLPGTWHVTNQGAGQLVRVRGRGAARRGRRPGARRADHDRRSATAAPRAAPGELRARQPRAAPVGSSPAPRLPRVAPRARAGDSLAVVALLRQPSSTSSTDATVVSSDRRRRDRGRRSRRRRNGREAERQFEHPTANRPQPARSTSRSRRSRTFRRRTRRVRTLPPGRSIRTRSAR